MKFQQIRQQCLEANLELGNSDLVDMTFGNASVYDPAAKVFAIKPSGVGYEQLTADDMVVVDMDGNVVNGQMRPSSDTATHRYLYQAFSGRGISGVVHTHSRSAVAFAQAGHSIPCLGTTHADFFNGPIPVTRAMTPAEIGSNHESKDSSNYEWETGKVIVEAFADLDPTQMQAALVRSHGPFVWGNSIQKAVEHAFALEIVAGMALQTLAIDSAVAGIPDALREKHFFRKHGSSAYYGQASAGTDSESV